MVSLSSFVDRAPLRFRQKATTLALLTVSWYARPSLVHVHHGYGVDQVLGLVRRRRLPLVVSFHGHDLTGHLVAHPNAYDRARGLMSAVVVPSRFLADLASEAGFDPRVVHVIPAGVDTRYFAPSPPPEPGREVLFVGRFVEKKGLDVLARAWPLIAEKVPGARLRLLGFGPLEPLARSIPGLVEVVVAPGREEVRDAMRQATVVVTPSHVAAGDAVESMLAVNLEAQASGRPVVTTRHGGIPEFVAEGETALLVREGDHRELAAAVVRILSDRELARRLGEAGPLLARCFDVRAMAARMVELYDWLCEAGFVLGPRPWCKAFTAGPSSRIQVPSGP